MLLGVRFLTDVQNVNSYEAVSQIEIYNGDQQDVYFQLLDSSIDRSEQGFNPPGRRYMPAATSTLSVELVNIDDSVDFKRQATQPFAQDPSIWKLPILSSDPLTGTVTLKFVLTEPSRTLNATLIPGILLRIR